MPHLKTNVPNNSSSTQILSAILNPVCYPKLIPANKIKKLKGIISSILNRAQPCKRQHGFDR